MLVFTLQTWLDTFTAFFTIYICFWFTKKCWFHKTKTSFFWNKSSIQVFFFKYQVDKYYEIINFSSIIHSPLSLHNNRLMWWRKGLNNTSRADVFNIVLWRMTMQLRITLYSPKIWLGRGSILPRGQLRSKDDSQVIFL